MGIFVEFLRWIPLYFFPNMCYGCGKEGHMVCPSCRPTVERVFDHPICPSCHNPSPAGLTHPGCQKTRRLDGLASYYRYKGWAKEIVKQAKFGKHHCFRGLKKLSKEFGNELASKNPAFFKKDGPFQHAVLVPVPLHWWRQRKRGFNQAAVIAKEFSKVLSLPLDERLLKRTRYTDPQTLLTASIQLSLQEQKKFSEQYPSVLNRKRAIDTYIRDRATQKRAQNMRRAFAITKSADLPTSVLLVDDVWTTGATMRACCRVLKRAGVKWVGGLTLLRA